MLFLFFTPSDFNHILYLYTLSGYGLQIRAISCTKKRIEKIEQKTSFTNLCGHGLQILAISQLASSYAYLMQKDSLIKYIKKTDEIDSKFVNPKVREIAKKK